MVLDYEYLVQGTFDYQDWLIRDNPYIIQKKKIAKELNENYSVIKTSTRFSGRP